MRSVVGLMCDLRAQKAQQGVFRQARTLLYVSHCPTTAVYLLMRIHARCVIVSMKYDARLSKTAYGLLVALASLGWAASLPFIGGKSRHRAVEHDRPARLARATPSARVSVLVHPHLPAPGRITWPGAPLGRHTLGVQ